MHIWYCTKQSSHYLGCTPGGCTRSRHQNRTTCTTTLAHPHLALFFFQKQIKEKMLEENETRYSGTIQAKNNHTYRRKCVNTQTHHRYQVLKEFFPVPLPSKQTVSKRVRTINKNTADRETRNDSTTLGGKGKSFTIEHHTPRTHSTIMPTFHRTPLRFSKKPGVNCHHSLRIRNPD